MTGHSSTRPQSVGSTIPRRKGCLGAVLLGLLALTAVVLLTLAQEDQLKTEMVRECFAGALAPARYSPPALGIALRLLVLTLPEDHPEDELPAAAEEIDRCVADGQVSPEESRRLIARLGRLGAGLPLIKP